MIIGKLIPAATGLKRYRRIEIEPAEPLPARDRRRRPARPGRDRRRARARRRRRPGRLRRRVRRATSRRSRTSAPAARTPGFAEELADLDVPDGRQEAVSHRNRRCSAAGPGRPGPAVVSGTSSVQSAWTPRRSRADVPGVAPVDRKPPEPPQLRVSPGTSRGLRRDRDYRRPGLLMVQACQRDADCRRAASARRTPLRPAPLTTPTLIS